MNLFKLVSGFIAFVFAVIIAIWIAVAVLLNKGCHAIQDKGLKGITEQVWNGTNTVNDPSTNSVQAD